MVHYAFNSIVNIVFDENVWIATHLYLIQEHG